jgi:hypothetical protein
MAAGSRLDGRVAPVSGAASAGPCALSELAQVIAAGSRLDGRVAPVSGAAALALLGNSRRLWPPDRGWTGGLLRYLAPRPPALALMRNPRTTDSLRGLCAYEEPAHNGLAPRPVRS